MGETRWVYDTEEECYEGGPSDFKAIQEFLANEWENDLYPATDMYEDMYDKIMAATEWNQLELYASGLGYKLEEVIE